MLESQTVTALRPATEPLVTLGKGVRADVAATRKGTRRVAEILQAALEHIAESGYESLSLEQIAERVGISKGNLQYYFPARSNLLQAAFAEQIERHKKQWSAVIGPPASGADSRLRRLIAFELEANLDRTFVALVLERWALAERDPALRTLTKSWHRWVIGQYARLIAELRPDLEKRAHRELATLAYSMLVGLAPYAPRSAGLGRRATDAILAAIAVAK